MTQIRLAIADEADLESAKSSVAEAQAQGAGDLKMETVGEVKEGEIGSESAVVTGLLVTGGVALLAGVVMEWVERLRGGTLIDTSTDPLTLDRTNDVPYGFFIVVASDGKVTIDAKNTPKGIMQQVLEKLIDGAFASMKDVKEAVESVAGETAKVVD